MIDSPLIPELYCKDIDKTVSFYTDILGFKIEFARPEHKFVMLLRNGARIMFEQLGTDIRKWITAPLEYPFGRGISFQLDTIGVADLYKTVKQHNATVFLPLEEKWYRANEQYLGNLQFIVQDPDGYLLRFAEDLGARADVPESI